jgi:hypothetical protein
MIGSVNDGVARYRGFFRQYARSRERLRKAKGVYDTAAGLGNPVIDAVSEIKAAEEEFKRRSWEMNAAARVLGLSPEEMAAIEAEEAPSVSAALPKKVA